MDTGLLHLHNILRWVILLLLLVTFLQAVIKDKGVQKTSLFLLIATHTMLLIGLYQWLAGRYGIFTSEIPEGTSLMKDKFWRFYRVEHPTMMLVATGVITLARKRAKTLRYGAVAILLLLALILLAAAVPWPFRGEPIGRPWFPGM